VAAINELYERWRSAWLKLEPKLMLSCFDAEFDGLIYQSEENPEALFTHADLVKYWNNAPSILSGVSEWTDLKKRIVFLGGDSAVIWTLLQTNLNLKTSPPQDLGGKLRCVLGVRKAKGKWSIVHYNESRQFLISPNQEGLWDFAVDYTAHVRR
jgi:hypothetical protein